MSYLKRVIVVLAAAVGCGALAQTLPPISISISAIAPVDRSLHEVGLEIRISNTSEHAIRIQTADTDPPVTVFGIDEDGQQAIITKPAVKNGNTRNREYDLAAGETRTYKTTIGNLLTPEQTVPDSITKAVELYVLLAVVECRDSGCSANSISSNRVRIEVAPREDHKGR